MGRRKQVVDRRWFIVGQVGRSETFVALDCGSTFAAINTYLDTRPGVKVRQCAAEYVKEWDGERSIPDAAVQAAVSVSGLGGGLK